MNFSIYEDEKTCNILMKSSTSLSTNGTSAYFFALFPLIIAIRLQW